MNTELQQPLADPVIELDCVSKVYGDAAARVVALDCVDLQISRGEFVGVMGASGSGKSTCMNIMGCLDTPSSGRYRLLGVDVSQIGSNERSLLRRHYLGFVFQSYNLLPRMTALANVELPLVYRSVSAAERRRRAAQALLDVGLGDRVNHKPGELSGGQQQRVAIARALVSEPSILFADEPTGNLDSTRSMEIMHLLEHLNAERGLTIVLITHEPELVSVTSRLLVFRDGRIIADGPPEEVL